MPLPRILKIISDFEPNQKIEAAGWVRTKREAKTTLFIELNDGSSLRGLQCVAEIQPGAQDLFGVSLGDIQTGASLRVQGELVSSPAKGQRVELQLEGMTLLGRANPEQYPLQKKAHSMEFLREISHLRPRTNTFSAVARLRSELAFAIHSFFRENDFSYVHTPLITASDCEGAGAQFQVTTLDLEALSAGKKKLDYAQDFFGKRTALTVSGQLNAETYATALGRVYTFGPTFRAENSNTSRHLAEFWMVEPEAAFFDLNDNMDLAENFLKYLFSWVLKNCAVDLDFFNERIERGVKENLESLVDARFTRMTYTDAVKELERVADRFEFTPYWGCDLQSEHERFLTEEVAHGPTIVTDYPKEIKAFYMKQNPDGKTVRAMDVLVPRLGEIIGGSERESDFDKLSGRMRELGLKESDYWWYLDLRRFGTVPHSGFGLGFERLIQYVSGMANIRDVIPFPRASQLADF